MDKVTLESALAVMPKYADMKFWFIPLYGNEYCVYSKSDEFKEIGTIIDNNRPDTDCRLFSDLFVPKDDISDEEISSITADFDLYKNRPEYAIGSGIDFGDNQFKYEWIFIGCIMMRAQAAGKDPDIVPDRYASAIKWLRQSGFYTDPASTQYHEAYPGGLLEHTLKVVKQIRDVINIPAFKYADANLQSAVTCALVHDWCKIGSYESYMRNVKNAETGTWEQVSSYRKKDTRLPLGHGVASYFIASKFFNFTPEEALAIRWHMGRWNVAEGEVNEFQQANEQIPLVHLLQFADMLAITDYAN